MRIKFLMAVGASAAMMFGTSAAYAATCTPGVCSTPKASFVVSPTGVGPGFMGPISGSISDSGIAKGSFSDTFSFLLPYSGTGAGSVTSVAATFHGITDLDFTSIAVNGTTVASAAMGNVINGVVDSAFASGIMLNAGSNQIVINGISRGNGSYGGSVSFIPAVPELATWGMMIFGFAAMGTAMRYRRKSSKVAFA